MNEEIARILQLLESGKITADEAERLIKAVKGPAGASAESSREAEEETFKENGGTPTCPNPFRDLEQLVRTIGRAYRGGLRRHRRFEEWRWHEYRRSREEERRKRAESDSTADRVRYVVVERAFLDPSGSLVGLDEVARDLLRYELEEEFGIEIPRDDLETVETIDALAAYIESRMQPPPPPPKPRAQPPAKKPAARPGPARARKPRPEQDLPAG